MKAVYWLRAEGAFVAIIAGFLAWQLSTWPWWVTFLVFLAPDLSMLGYRFGNIWGARIYNLAHNYLAPLTFLLASAIFFRFVLISNYDFDGIGWVQYLSAEQNTVLTLLKALKVEFLSHLILPIINMLVVTLLWIGHIGLGSGPINS